MRFPLNEKIVIGYNYGVPTSYSPKHLGVDWKAEYVSLYAPKNGTIIDLLVGPQGGKTIWFKPSDENIIIRWLHLDQWLVTKGQQVKEGQVIAITGNTGVSTGPHLHEDIWKSKVTLKFEDTINPHNYYAERDSMILVENNGTYYEEGEKGYLGIANIEYLNFKLKITDKVEHRIPKGNQLGVIENAPSGFIIKNN